MCSLLKAKHLPFTSTPNSHARATAPVSASSLPKQNISLDNQKLEIQNNLQVIRAQIATAKIELDKLNQLSKDYSALNHVRERLFSNCNGYGYTKVKCAKAPGTTINSCMIKYKHPELKSKITELQ